MDLTPWAKGEVVDRVEVDGVVTETMKSGHKVTLKPITPWIATSMGKARHLQVVDIKPC